jgi:glycosyltransferase involved in cell wall biosynthesis
MTYPKISIVTPSLNQGRFIEQCISGVLYQDYPNFEHVIVDGASNDETISILKKYPHIRWISEPDTGMSEALNKGIRLTTGSIITECNADDYFLPGAFKLAIELIRKNPSVSVIYGDYRIINAEGKPIRVRREIDFDLFILKYLHICYIPIPGAIWRKEVHAEGFWFNEKLHYAMDAEFFLRLALAGYSFRHVPALLADYRVHVEAKSADKRQKEEHERIYRSLSPLLRRSSPLLASAISRILLCCARTKRIFIRAVRGHYIEQWWRKG